MRFLLDSGQVNTLFHPAWKTLYRFLSSKCDRFAIHWWFRPPLDRRPLWEQMLYPEAGPQPEPIPPDLPLGRLAPHVETVVPSYVCPNGACAQGRLTPEVCAILLAPQAAT